MRIADLLLSITLVSAGGCQAPSPPSPTGPYHVEPVSEKVAVVTGPRSFKDGGPAWDTITEISHGKLNRPDEPFPGTANVCYFSSSGIGTYGGWPRPPIHFADIVAPSGRRMRLYVQIAADRGVICRSLLAWGGDYLPGIRCAGRGYSSGPFASPERGDSIAGEVDLRLPGRDDVVFIFVGYNDRGELVPAFGKPFAEYVRSLATRPTTGPTR